MTLANYLNLTDDEFYELAGANPDLKLERSANGALIIMPPTGGETGNQNFDISGQLWFWNKNSGLGVAFDSSTCFKLPNGANRSPDASWVLRDRWEALTPEQRRKFPPLAPDFVIELRSTSDRLEDVRAKMSEYRDNGVRLGWLINPQDKQVEIFKPSRAVVILNNPRSLSGEEVLPGFVLDLTGIF
jgi:Uma2 family endonuclease